LVYEVATAVAGRVLGINPFDQPDVESAKAAAREVLSDSAPAAVGGSIDAAAIDDLLSRVGERDYLAVQVYLDRWAHADFASVRDTLQARLGRPVTFGWGPRFLHSTGQFHKGGTPEGVFLQITGAPVEDLAVPGRDFTLGQFIAAQAAGDARVLRNHGRPVLRLHLQDVTTELPRLRAILR
jgi:glucose-6-phosphate isomerase